MKPRAGRALALEALVVCICIAGGANAHGDVHGRIEALNAALVASPADSEKLAERAWLYTLDEDWARALSDYEAAYALAPDQPELRYRFSNALLRSGQPQRAVVLLDLLIQKHPGSADAYAERARAQRELGRLELAVEDYDEAIRLRRPPAPRLYRERSEVLQSQRRSAEAVAGLREGIEILGPVASLVEPAVEIEVSRSEWDAALELVASLPPRVRDSPRWLARRAQILSLTGDTGRANEATREAIAAIDTLPSPRAATGAMVSLREELVATLDAAEPVPETPSAVADVSDSRSAELWPHALGLAVVIGLALAAWARRARVRAASPTEE